MVLMSEATYGRDLYDKITEELQAAKDRSKPVLVGSGEPTVLLSQLVLAFPAVDQRLDPLYKKKHLSVYDTSDLWARNVSAGVKVRLENARPGTGRVTVALDFHSNTAEFERFNSVVRDHNENWEKDGCPEDTFDPWNGDVDKVRDGYVDFATTDESQPMRGDVEGPLHNARPTARRSGLVSVEYRVTDDGFRWTLGFVASDLAGRLLCWNEIQGEDLSKLVRRSVQMLYGNPAVQGDYGPLSDGLTMLVQGRKVGLCRQSSKTPAWVSGAPKDFNPELVAAKVEEVAFEAVHATSGYLLPICFLVGMVVWACFCLIQTWSGYPHRQGPCAGFWWFAGGEVVILILMWISVSVSTHAKRAAEASHMRQSYL
jgi:hypothetical protein